MTFRIACACLASVASLEPSAPSARRGPTQNSLVVLFVPSVVLTLFLQKEPLHVGIVNAMRDSNKPEKIVLHAAWGNTNQIQLLYHVCGARSTHRQLAQEALQRTIVFAMLGSQVLPGNNVMRVMQERTRARQVLTDVIHAQRILGHPLVQQMRAFANVMNFTMDPMVADVHFQHVL